MTKQRLPLRLEWELVIRDDETLSPMARLLAFTLRTYMNAAGECWPLVGTLARNMNVSPDTVQRARRELVKAGLLEVVAHRGHANHYKARNSIRAVGVRHPCGGGTAPMRCQTPHGTS